MKFYKVLFKKDKKYLKCFHFLIFITIQHNSYQQQLHFMSLEWKKQKIYEKIPLRILWKIKSSLFSFFTIKRKFFENSYKTIKYKKREKRKRTENWLSSNFWWWQATTTAAKKKKLIECQKDFKICDTYQWTLTSFKRKNTLTYTLLLTHTKSKIIMATKHKINNKYT